MAQVDIQSIDKICSNGCQALFGLDLTVADGEFMVLVGPSGCGKSTALRCIAGLEDVSAGDILLDGASVIGEPSSQRDMAMVFQNYALYPHMTVAENMGFSLKLSGVSKDEIRARVADAAARLELSDVIGSKPARLSGGRRQRVAMGRAIVRRPRVFLMDEPLSNLDAKLRVKTRAEIAALQRDLGLSTVYVTHDQVEAMTMADRVAGLRDGALHQVDTPKTLYHHPRNAFVAAFIGSPAMNLFEAAVSDGRLELGPAAALDITDSIAARHDIHTGQKVIVGVRPESITLANPGDNAAGLCQMPARVKLVESLGAEGQVHLEIDASRATTGDHDIDGESLASEGACVARVPESDSIDVGDMVLATFDPTSIHLFSADDRTTLRRRKKELTA